MLIVTQIRVVLIFIMAGEEGYVGMDLLEKRDETGQNF